MKVATVILLLQINAHALTNALSAETKPWIELGTSLGTVAKSLLQQTNFSNVKITVTTSGE